MTRHRVGGGEGAVRLYVPGRGVLASGRSAIRDAAAWLASGNLLAHPTSTVYGLGARPEPELDRAIARLKRRGDDRPLLRVAASRDEVEALVPAGGWPAEAAALADRFWPGPLTLILPDGSGSGLGVRVDAHPVLRALLEDAGGSMTSTSLNPTGEEPVRRADAALVLVDRMAGAEAAGGARLALLAAGDLPPSPPSTIVALLGREPVLVREGAIPWPEVCAALVPADPDRARTT